MESATTNRLSRAVTAWAVLSSLALVLAEAAVPSAFEPLDFDRGASGLGLALRRVGTTGRVLYVTAHPDDEHNGVLVRLSRGLGLRTALLTVTRGEGGQNAIGPELFDALGVLRTGELLSPTEAKSLEGFHAARRKWLAGYAFGRTCDPECRGKLVDVMLSSFGEAQGDYDEPLQRLLKQSRAEAGATLGHLHARLLWCQIDGGDLNELRDRVLVPAFVAAMGDGKADGTMVEDLAGLVALVPEPDATDAKDLAKWKAMLAALDKGNDKVQRTFNVRRTSAARERANPPPMIKKVNFCNAASAMNLPSIDQ
jgi:hypothetical protein